MATMQDLTSCTNRTGLISGDKHGQAASNGYAGREGSRERNGQPPATAGMTETCAPEGTRVSRPWANRTSSSPT